MNYKRGHIVLALFPDSNLRSAKRRPVLVVQKDNLGAGLDQVVVAMITSNMARAGHPSRVTAPMTSGLSTGLKLDSVIMTDNLCTLSGSELDKTLGSWPDMAAVDAALRHTLGI